MTEARLVSLDVLVVGAWAVVVLALVLVTAPRGRPRVVAAAPVPPPEPSARLVVRAVHASRGDDDLEAFLVDAALTELRRRELVEVGHREGGWWARPVRRADAGGTWPHEQVLLRRIAAWSERSDGVVPLAALGPQPDGRRTWVDELVDAAVSRAREEGLVRPRVPAAVRRLLEVLLAVGFALAVVVALLDLAGGRRIPGLIPGFPAQPGPLPYVVVGLAGFGLYRTVRLLAARVLEGPVPTPAGWELLGAEPPPAQAHEISPASAAVPVRPAVGTAWSFMRGTWRPRDVDWSSRASEPVSGMVDGDVVLCRRTLSPLRTPQYWLVVDDGLDDGLTEGVPQGSGDAPLRPWPVTSEQFDEARHGARVRLDVDRGRVRRLEVRARPAAPAA